MMPRLTGKEWDAVMSALSRGEDSIEDDESIKSEYVVPPSPLLKAVRRGRSKLVQARQDRRI